MELLCAHDKIIELFHSCAVLCEGKHTKIPPNVELFSTLKNYVELFSSFPPPTNTIQYNVNPWLARSLIPFSLSVGGRHY